LFILSTLDVVLKMLLLSDYGRKDVVVKTSARYSRLSWYDLGTTIMINKF